MKKGEIVYCNLKIQHKNKTILLKEVVYKLVDGLYYNKRILDAHKISKAVKVLNVDIIARLGFENKNLGYTEAVANDNHKRNKITGSYD